MTCFMDQHTTPSPVELCSHLIGVLCLGECQMVINGTELLTRVLARAKELVAVKVKANEMH